MEKKYLAIDLGAETGRAILGRLDRGLLRAEEVHRFANTPIAAPGRLSWDFPRLLDGVREGIRRAAQRAGGRLDGIAVDSWGVDFGLLDGDGRLLANPVHYRDPRHSGMLEKVCARVPRAELWRRTGVQPFEINTLFQLAALREREPELLAAAQRLLMVADLVAYSLGARAVAETTLASTSQLLDASTRRWSEELIDTLELPRAIFPEIVGSGTVTGTLRSDLAAEAGFELAPPLVAAASHDTACAVASVPAASPGGWAYLSSGTWSLLGVELDAPELGREALEAGFTNEAGAGGKTRFLRILTGLWLIQECRRHWALEGDEPSYAELAKLAEEAPPARAFIDPDDPRLRQPGDMPQRIQDACRERAGFVPQSRGEIVRAVLESLARRYAEVARDAERVTGRRVERLHVVGGGSRHRLLNELTAARLGLPVVAGPVEATATGNILLQALATGEIASLRELRRIAAASAEVATV